MINCFQKTFTRKCVLILNYNSQLAHACVSVNLNELVMRHIPAVKRLLVVHKAWEFSLLHFLAAQHQHSGRGGRVGTRGRQVLQIGGPLNGLAVALSLLQINNSPRLAHKGQHEHVVRFPVGLRAQRPQTCVWGRDLWKR